MSDVVLNRLRRCLIEALDRRGHDIDQPITVAQLYEELVPYREVRPRLGVDLNADYEHALLRLLAGEGGMLRVQPAEAQEELRREAAEPYPFVGLFRKFASCSVWVESMDAPAAARAAPAADPPAEAGRTPAPEDNGRGASGQAGSAPPAATPEAEPTSVGTTGPPSEPDAGRPSGPGPQRSGLPGPGPDSDSSAEPAAPPTSEPPPGSPPAARPPAGAPSHRAEPAPPTQGAAPPAERAEAFLEERRETVVCGSCREPLPAGRRVRYCPYCGSEARLRPCPRCDELLREDWRFCIGCGHDLASERTEGG